MKPKTRSRISVAVLMAIALVTAGFVALVVVTSDRRRAALLRVTTPPTLTAHERLAAEAGGGDADNVGEESDGGAGDIGVLARDGDAGAARESLEAFTGLLERKARELDGDDAWRALRTEMPFTASEGWSPGDRARVARLLEDHGAFLAQLRAAAESGGPVRALSLAEPAFRRPLPHLAAVRECAELLWLSSVSAALEGDCDHAAREIVGILQLADCLRTEPTVLSQTARYSTKRLAFGAIQETLACCSLSRQAADGLLEQLALGRDRGDLARAIGGEQVAGIRLFAHLIEEGAGSEIASELLGAEGAPHTTQTWLMTSIIGRPWFSQDERVYVETLQQLREAAELPFYEAKPRLDQIKAVTRASARPQAVSSRLLPWLMDTQRLRAECESRLDLARVAIALELYKTEHAAFPTELDAVADFLGGDVPVDTLTGGVFHYVPQGDTFLLYSVGTNLEDDGGETYPGAKGDIVWRNRQQQ